MTDLELQGAHVRAAVAAIDCGDVAALELLLSARPHLACERLECGEGYFQRPYLVCFVAENPIRNGRLPANVADVARAILRAAERHAPKRVHEQAGSALSLVCSGRVARECGVQRALIDVLADAGADLDGALVPALAHRELAAAEQLLGRGAALTLLAAVCTGRAADFARLVGAASASERQAAFAGAAFYGRTDSLARLIALGVDVSAFSPRGFHQHATALHHAVDSGSLDAVRLLVEAGTALDVKDRVWQGTPLDWAEHLERAEIAAFLRDRTRG